MFALPSFFIIPLLPCACIPLFKINCILIRIFLVYLYGKKEGVLARDNYSYQKYRRELAKKKKKEEKMQRKLDKKNVLAGENPGQVSNDDSAVK